jgi:hypothetical protein
MSEKRQFERAEFDGQATIEIAGKKHQGRVRDLSVGGAYVVSEQKPAFGTEVTLTLQLPALIDKGPSTLSGIVRWIRDDGFGIQFGPTGAYDTYGLAEFVMRKNAGR